MKVSNNFDLREFIDPIGWEAFGGDSIKLIDKRLIDIAQFIRDKSGVSCVINNWHIGGQYKESGLRQKNTTTGAKNSAHKLGKAIDIKIGNMNGKQMFQFAVKYSGDLYKLGVRRIEDFRLTPTWLHLDTKEHSYKNSIVIIDLTQVVDVIQIKQ